jgi:hypothetical protein
VKQQSLTKLEAISAQADNLHTTQLFFPLLQEFCLTLLPNSYLQDELSRISAKETAFQEWFDSITQLLPPENRASYLAQYKGITAFYALNQIKVFFERYDFVYHDSLVRRLKEQGVDVRQLQDEHSELMKYQITGKYPKIFPSLDEYKHYMRRITGALREELPDDSSPIVPVRPFKFDKETSSLCIGDHEPFIFIRNDNPAVLLGYMSEKMWTSVSEDDIFDDLGLDHNELKRTIRQIKERIKNLPQLLMFSDHPRKLEKKIVALSPSYKPTQ